MPTAPSEPTALLTADLGHAERELKDLTTKDEDSNVLGESMRRIQHLRNVNSPMCDGSSVEATTPARSSERGLERQRSKQQLNCAYAKVPSSKTNLSAASVVVVPTIPVDMDAKGAAREAENGACGRPQNPSRALTGADRDPSALDLSHSAQPPCDNDQSHSDGEEHSLDINLGMDMPASAGRTNRNILDIAQATRARLDNGGIHGESVRRAREDKLKRTERRRGRATRRFDLVEEMFARAVERRMWAMRRSAADPPAERFIGHSSVQHIPVALLPGQLRQTAMALATMPAQREADPTTTTARAESFFITGVDAKATEARAAPEEEEEVRETPAEGHAHREGRKDSKGRKESEGGRSTETQGAARDEPVLDEELLRHWRELGYTAVFLPATRRLIDTRQPFDPHAWMRLEPLPPVHLVQRQLPPVGPRPPPKGLPGIRRSTNAFTRRKPQGLSEIKQLMETFKCVTNEKQNVQTVKKVEGRSDSDV